MASETRAALFAGSALALAAAAAHYLRQKTVDPVPTDDLSPAGDATVAEDDLLKRSFLERALLNQEAFFAALRDAGYPDMTTSPFSDAVFKSFCQGHSGVPLHAAHVALWRVEVCRDLFKRVNGGKPLSYDMFRTISATALGRLLAEADPETPNSIALGCGEASTLTGTLADGQPPLPVAIRRRPTSRSNVTRRRSTSLAVLSASHHECFLRHDYNGDGQLDELEFTTMCLTMCLLAETFQV